jgi:hypothetical protein
MLKRYNNLKTLRPLEVIVAVLVCLFLLTIILVVYRKARADAARVTCAKNLSIIGKAMMSYSNNYDGKLPRSGGVSSNYGDTPNWRGANRFDAFDLRPDGSRGRANISSCFYLLVKYSNVAPKFFVCPSNSGTTEFKLADTDAGDRKLADLWNFGRFAYKHCSYSYHMPFGFYPLTTAYEPGMAVAADRNPWIASPAWIKSPSLKPKAFPGKFSPDGGREAVKAGNSPSHQRDGQNVLFLDDHVSFEERSFCGINDDNIYTSWGGADIRVGADPAPGEPMGKTDSILIHDLPQVAPISFEELKKLKGPND